MKGTTGVVDICNNNYYIDYRSKVARYQSLIKKLKNLLATKKGKFYIKNE